LRQKTPTENAHAPMPATRSRTEKAAAATVASQGWKSSAKPSACD